MIVLDTTVLIYTVGTEHPFRGPSRELIQAIADRRIEATTTVEVVQEFVHVRARRRNRDDAASLGRDFVELLAPLLVVEGEDLLAGLTLYERNDGIGAFDSVLVAAAARNGVDALVSADRAFDRVGDVRHVTPDMAGVASLLSTTG